MWNYVYPSHELYHHGILGQRWGKKNGPPYPIAASGHSASEKKAGWKKSLSGGSGDKVRYDSQSVKSKAKSSKSIKKKSLMSALNKKMSSITPEQKAKAKKIAITALKVAGAIAIAAVVGYVGAKYIANPIMLKKISSKADPILRKAQRAQAIRRSAGQNFLNVSGKSNIHDSIKQRLYDRALRANDAWDIAERNAMRAQRYVDLYTYGNDLTKFKRQMDHFRQILIAR